MNPRGIPKTVINIKIAANGTAIINKNPHKRLGPSFSFQLEATFSDVLGKIHIKSTHGLDAPINLTYIVIRELTLYSSRCGPFDKAIEGLKSKKISVEGLISEIYELDDIIKAFESYKSNHDHIKTIIHI